MELQALMVKRSRRRPLTAESRVRFPLGVPQKYKEVRWLLFFVTKPTHSGF